MLERRVITHDHLNSLFRLKVAKDQGDQVTRNEITLVQQVYEPGSAVWGLWVGDTIVGLLAMINPREVPDPDESDDPDAAYIWRLMIGAEHQGKGLGRAAIEHAREVALDWGLQRLCLTFTEKADGAEGFYAKLGFKRTGRVVDGEQEMIRDL